MKFFLIFLLFCTTAFATTVEDVIKEHKLDMNREEDRCSLLYIIEQHHPDVFSNKDVVESYYGPIGNYSNDMFVERYRDVALPLNNSIISVTKDVDTNYLVANINFVGSNLIVKLNDGSMISNIYRGYIVPFEYIRLDKDYKLANKLAVLQSSPPKGNIKYFKVEKCIVKIVN
jgi:hypothetical protein